jgi:hypothetical protein
MIGVIRWAFRMTQTVMVVLFWNGVKDMPKKVVDRRHFFHRGNFRHIDQMATLASWICHSQNWKREDTIGTLHFEITPSLCLGSP